jgi:hypothetical protein
MLEFYKNKTYKQCIQIICLKCKLNKFQTFGKIKDVRVALITYAKSAIKFL